MHAFLVTQSTDRYAAVALLLPAVTPLLLPMLLLPSRVVQAAGRQVAKQSGALDGQLFVIQHLLFLREQIAQFDVEFSVTDIDLDFTHMRDHMRRIMSGKGLGKLVLQMRCFLRHAVESKAFVDVQCGWRMFGLMISLNNA
jgi:hypothetical protein